MKKIILIGAMLLSAPATAGEFYAGPAWGKNCPGQKVRVDQYMYFLSATSKCELPIVNAPHMRALYVKAPQSQPYYGCWGELLGDEYLLVYRDGTTQKLPKAVFALVRASTNDDGVVVSSFAVEQGISKCD